MTPNWAQNAIFYHIYPLGLLGAPDWNDCQASVHHRLNELVPWVNHSHALGANAIYLGPVFQSSSHGYDTVDYYQVDRRLGDNQDLKRFAEVVHSRGMRLVLDGVFNHVGRDFWAFRDLLDHGERSSYRDWFHAIRFGERSPKGDPFNYEGWHGHTSLVKLNLSNPAVREHLFAAVRLWLEEFGIDGLRLDAADCVDRDFLQALRRFTSGLREDFWLMGEVVHGDYRQWVNPETLHSVTNYECYKGLYSSLLDGNYFEIAYALNRQFGEGGVYRGNWLYNFVDNHDVDRVASKLGESSLLYPLYLLLFTMPGLPSIYYGSEWGLLGEKAPHSDDAIRPALDLDQVAAHPPEGGLVKVIAKLASLRQRWEALRTGDYHQIAVHHHQMAFLRESQDGCLLVVLNSAPETAELDISLSCAPVTAEDLLNPGYQVLIKNGKTTISIPPLWGRILKLG